MEHTEVAFIVLFAVATGVAIAARRLAIPYTVALVGAGLVIGVTDLIDPPHLTKELLYAVFLPGLLFEAAYHLEFKRFWSNKVAIASLAMPGLLAAIALTAAILAPVANALQFVSDFQFIHALVFASLIAATDPIAVVGLFKSLGAPKRLGVLIEGESLLNDGAAVVIFTLVLTVAAGGALSLPEALGKFVVVAGMGVIIGALFGLAVSWLMRFIDEPMVEITLTTIAAYGSFVAAEHFHWSGVIATVVAGMLCGNYATTTGMSPSTRIAVESFWEYVAFALNSIVFLLIGFEVDIFDMVASWQPILVAWLAVMTARVVVVFTASALLRRTSESIPWGWSAVLSWGGLRGALSMVLVLGLATDFPHRDFMVTMTFGVVVISIVVQGLLMAPVLKWVGAVGQRVRYERYERNRGDMRAATRALDALDAMERDRVTHADVIAELRVEYQHRVDIAEQAIRELHLETHELQLEERHAAIRQLLLVEKASVVDDYHSGVVDKDAFHELLADIDARILALESGPLPPAPASAGSASKD